MLLKRYNQFLNFEINFELNKFHLNDKTSYMLNTLTGNKK